MMNANPTSTSDNIFATDTDDSVSVVTIASTLLIMAVSVLAVALFSWFLKRCFCCCRKRSNYRDLEFCQDYNLKNPNSGDIEQGGNARCKSPNDNETTSTVPSVITISRSDRRWDHRHTPFRESPSKQVSQLSDARQSPLRNGQGCTRTKLPRHRSNYAISRPPREGATDSSPNANNFFDHNTILTSSCDGMSIPDDNCCLDNTSATEKRGKHKSKTFNARLKGESSFPNATIQFRNPINGKGGKRLYFQNGEIDLLVDFLMYTEDYVSYPRSKLTILLRAFCPETTQDKEELERLRDIVANACAFREKRPPLQVFIATTAGGSSIVSNDEDPLPCAPIGGLLVTFESIWDLPEDHRDFLKDLVV